MGCNKCKKKFPGPFGSRDYGGFDCENWVPRTNTEHRQQMAEVLLARNKTEQQKLESQFGTRYSVLSELDYVDLITMTIIDPMHNLFLGMTFEFYWFFYFNRNSCLSIYLNVRLYCYITRNFQKKCFDLFTF